MKVYGFDIDGVISGSFPRYIPRKIMMIIWHCLFEIKWFWQLYNRHFRRANEKVIRVLREIKNRDCRVVIISGNPEWRRPELEEYFKKEDIPYDKMILAPSAIISVAGWKRKMVKEEGCIYFLDDMTDVVVCINKSRSCRAIRYYGQETEEVLKELGL